MHANFIFERMIDRTETNVKKRNRACSQKDILEAIEDVVNMR